MVRKKRVKTSDNKKMYIKVFVLIATLSSLLMLQSYRINNVNIAISELKINIEQTQMMNDSLHGKVLSKRDLNKIEKIAIERYGMIKPSNKKFTYVAINTKNEKSLANAKQKNETKNEKKKGTLLNKFLGKK